MSNIYYNGMPPDELRTKLRHLTESTKDNHEVHDTRYPGFATSLISFDPIRESKGVVADVMIAVVPGGKAPQAGDIIVIPGKNNTVGGTGMIFDIEAAPGDWGHFGDTYHVKAVQCNPQLGLGHEFTDRKQSGGMGGVG